MKRGGWRENTSTQGAEVLRSLVSEEGIRLGKQVTLAF